MLVSASACDEAGEADAAEDYKGDGDANDHKSSFCSRLLDRRINFPCVRHHLCTLLRDRIRQLFARVMVMMVVLIN